MQKYIWKGVDLLGNNCKGNMQAESKKEVCDTLFKQGLAVFSVKRSWKTHITLFFDRLKNNEQQLVAFFYHSSILLSSGLPLVTTLKLVTSQLSSHRLRHVVRLLLHDVKKGMLFSDAMGKYHTIFTPFMIQMVRSGERAGDLGMVFSSLGDHLETKQAFEKKIKQAAFMPMLTILFAILIMASILVFVIPQFESFFMSTDKPLPESTKIVFAMSRFLRSKIAMPAILVFFICCFGLRYLFRWNSICYYKDLLMARFFSIGTVRDSMNYMKILAMLLRAGAPLSQSLIYAQNVVKNLYLQQKISVMPKMLQRGNSLAHVCRNVDATFFPEKCVAMIDVGEHTGTLAIMLEKASLLLKKEVDEKIKLIITLIQPLLMIAVGLIVAFFIVSVYVPIFSMANLVG